MERIKLYMQTFNRPGDNAPGWRSSPEDKWPLVSVVQPGRLEFSPVFSNPHGQRYLLPKHGAIGKLVYLDTLRATRVHGTVCFTGMLSNRWTVDEFYPIDYIPRGVRLTAYAGGADDLPAPVQQTYLDRLAAGSLAIGPLHTYTLDDIPRAHADLEHNHVFGKLVGVIDPTDAIGTPTG